MGEPCWQRCSLAPAPGARAPPEQPESEPWTSARAARVSIFPLVFISISTTDAHDAYRRRGEEGQNNPGNNLHVSGLSYKVDTRELEAAFARVGRVRPVSKSPRAFR